MLVSVKGCTCVTAGWSRLIIPLMRMIRQFSTIYPILFNLNLKKKKEKNKDCTLFTPMERTRVKLHDSSRHLFCPSLRLFVVWFLSIWVDGYCSGGRSHTSGSKTSCGYTIRLVICLLFLRMRSLLKEDSPLPLSLSRRRARFASQSLLRYNLKRKNVRIKRISFYSKNRTMRMRARACVLYGYIFLRILIINFNYRQQKITRALINIFISTHSIQLFNSSIFHERKN